MITENKMNALNKMLVEMNKTHSSTEDSIHNWLCKQEDESLFTGILKEDKTINGAMLYCMKKASNLQVNNAAMVDDQTVYDWVKEYFTLEKVDDKKIPVQAKVTHVKTAEAKSNEVVSNCKVKSSDFTPMKGEQLSLLDML